MTTRRHSVAEVPVADQPASDSTSQTRLHHHGGEAADEPRRERVLFLRQHLRLEVQVCGVRATALHRVPGVAVLAHVVLEPADAVVAADVIL